MIVKDFAQFPRANAGGGKILVKTGRVQNNVLFSAEYRAFNLGCPVNTWFRSAERFGFGVTTCIWATVMPVARTPEFNMKPITDEVIAQATRRIVTELEPEEIILFGSYAWGTPHKYSDLDLCVILPDGIQGFDRIEWGVRALNVLNDLNVDVDVLIKTRSDVEMFKTVPASLTRKIVEKGKLLYGQGKTSTSAILAQESST